ncbi:hypothetical protein, partial [Sedimentitalea todarodis]
LSVPFPARIARQAPQNHIAATPVKGVLRLLIHSRNPFFEETPLFPNSLHISIFINGLRQIFF